LRNRSATPQNTDYEHIIRRQKDFRSNDQPGIEGSLGNRMRDRVLYGVSGWTALRHAGSRSKLKSSGTRPWVEMWFVDVDRRSQSTQQAWSLAHTRTAFPSLLFFERRRQLVQVPYDTLQPTRSGADLTIGKHPRDDERTGISASYYEAWRGVAQQKAPVTPSTNHKALKCMAQNTLVFDKRCLQAIFLTSVCADDQPKKRLWYFL
jgi:hypothetical protein